ncbi:MAG: class I SAM-dependent RNA methyltransferase [Pseudomonadota bacterium]
MEDPLEIFCVCAPGLEAFLADEMVAYGFAAPQVVPGGVVFAGGWTDVWRANLELRGASRVLVRIGTFMAFHLAQLDKRARQFAWGAVLRRDVPVRVQVTCKASKIYHAKAAAQRIETALTETHGIPVSATADLVIKARIEDNRVTLSLDSSGAALHIRGHKQAVGKAPMRETLAALMLRAAGYTMGEPVLDPMCGAGTFVIEAAEMAMGLQPGRSRAFAFEGLASFDAEGFSDLRQALGARAPTTAFWGSDRDQGAVQMARANAAQAGLSEVTRFACHGASEARPPPGPPGLVIVNPPYGGRVGTKKMLYALYGRFGETMRSHFKGWRIALVTSEPGLAKATGLPWQQQRAPIPHGGLKVWLWQTVALA